MKKNSDARSLDARYGTRDYHNVSYGRYSEIGCISLSTVFEARSDRIDAGLMPAALNPADCRYWTVRGVDGHEIDDR
jgi:hypothetical protein